jgi:hypothetical protein
MIVPTCVINCSLLRYFLNKFEKIGYDLKPNWGIQVNLEDFENVTVINNLTETISILPVPAK